jgi:hypothetical protein
VSAIEQAKLTWGCNMTKNELLQNIAELTDNPSCLMSTLQTEINRLVNSGALPLDDEPADSAALGKCVLVVALENVSNDFSPMSWDAKRQKIIKNLRRF